MKRSNNTLKGLDPIQHHLGPPGHPRPLRRRPEPPQVKTAPRQNSPSPQHQKHKPKRKEGPHAL